jgi:putative membrane protein
MQLLTIFAMLAAAGGVLFALQNHETVAVSLFVWHFEASLAIVVLLALALGGLAVALVSTPSTLRRQWVINRQQKRIEELELRVATLQKEAAEAGRNALSNAADTAAASPYKEMPQLISGTNENT